MIRVAILGALLSVVSLPAHAIPTQAEMKAACFDDFRKFCLGIVPGEGRVLACMGSHVDELSPPCEKMVREEGGVGPAPEADDAGQADGKDGAPPKP